MIDGLVTGSPLFPTQLCVAGVRSEHYLAPWSDLVCTFPSRGAFWAADTQSLRGGSRQKVYGNLISQAFGLLDLLFMEWAGDTFDVTVCNEAESHFFCSSVSVRLWSEGWWRKSVQTGFEWGVLRLKYQLFPMKKPLVTNRKHPARMAARTHRDEQSALGIENLNRMHK